MVVHSISPHFFHSGVEAVTAVVGLAAVGAGSWEEAFPQDKSTGMRQETPSILLVKRRRFRTWREYDNAQTCREPLTRFRIAAGGSWSFGEREWSKNAFLPFPEASRRALRPILRGLARLLREIRYSGGCKAFRNRSFSEWCISRWVVVSCCMWRVFFLVFGNRC